MTDKTMRATAPGKKAIYVPDPLASSAFLAPIYTEMLAFLLLRSLCIKRRIFEPKQPKDSSLTQQGASHLVLSHVEGKVIQDEGKKTACPGSNNFYFTVRAHALGVSALLGPRL